MFGIGGQEIILLLVLGVLLFGANLPRLGRSVGKTVKEFKHGVQGLEDDIENVGNPTTARPAPEPARPPQPITNPGPSAVGVSCMR